MKKIILTAVILCGLLTTLVGCEQESAQQPPTDTVQFEQVFVNAEHGYTMLKYSGLDTNPQHFYTHYDVDDSDFVNEIWNAMNYVEWTEYDGKTQANVSIELTFTDDNGSSWRFDIDPNGIGWVTDVTVLYERVEPSYYTTGEGVYANVSRLLSEYSAEKDKK